MELYNNSTPNKTVELIIYISSRLKDKPNYGSTLLGKSMYLIDSLSYLRKGEPISDLKYIKQDYGPTPEPARFIPLRDVLVLTDELQQINVDYYGRLQKKYIAKREPNIQVFEKDELVLINDVIESICDQSASEISDYTHSFIAWIFAKNKEALPFYTFLLSYKQPDQKDIDWAIRSVENYKSKN